MAASGTDTSSTATPPGPDSGPIVDWGRTARRLRTSLLVILSVVLLVWAVPALLGGGWRWGRLGELVGLGLLAAFVVEVVVVGGSAVAGMLRAGARGDRLAQGDVSLLPPQVTGRRRR